MKLELTMRKGRGFTCAVIGLRFGTGSSPTSGKSASAYCENIGGVAVSLSCPSISDGPLIGGSLMNGPSLGSEGVGRLSMAYLSSFRPYYSLSSPDIGD